MDNYNMNQYPQDQKQQGGAGLAIAAMVLGIVALVLSCCTYYISLPCAIIGIILAAVSLKGQKPGKGMAIAGLVCAIVSLIPAILLIIFSGSIMSYLQSMNS